MKLYTNTFYQTNYPPGSEKNDFKYTITDFMTLSLLSSNTCTVKPSKFSHVDFNERLMDFAK